MKILIIEDEAPIRALLKRTVETFGHETETAENGEVGLVKFKSFAPDVVMTDILMPKMNGLEMLERIRKTNSEAIVIIVSAFGSADYTLRALQLRANDYIMKPFRPKVLKEYLDKYEEILKNRTIEQDIIGMFERREFVLKYSNNLELISKLVDKLMQETQHAIPRASRLGVHLGLLELLTNSIEHGNLEITFDEKKRALEQDIDVWKGLIDTRKCDPQLKDRQVTIQFYMNQQFCEWLITDEGPGFDWHKLPDQSDPEVLLAANGRGIMLANLQFDEFEYNLKGNQIRVRKYTAEPTAEPAAEPAK